MQIISMETKEKLYLDVPIFFLDSIRRDKNTNEELQRLICFAKSLPYIETIRECNNKYKEVRDEFEEVTNEVKEDGKIVVVTKTYRIRRFYDYNGKEAKVSRELYSVIKNDKEKELPKIDEKSVTPILAEFIKSMKVTYDVGNMILEMEDKRGKEFSRLERLGLFLLGSYVENK